MTEKATIDDAALQDAFALLRKRGLMRVQAFPPALIQALGINPVTPLDATREYVKSRLIAASNQLSDDLALVFQIVAGLRPNPPRGAEERFRQASAALKDQPSVGTVRRYYAEAARQVPAKLHAIRERSVRAEVDYAFLHSRTRFDLRSESPYIVNERTISAHSDWIDHVDEKLVLPRYDGDTLPMRALEGCTVEDLSRDERGAWTYKLVFPRTLRAGDRHSFATSIRLPSQDALVPIAAFNPRSTSYNATIELRFGDRLPVKLERFVAHPMSDGFPDLRDSEAVEPILPRHDFVFEQMEPLLFHGVRWNWDDGGFLPNT